VTAILTLTAVAVAAANPTPAKIKTAVARAEHSRFLWATVNICNTARHPEEIGIRGQMPALGFATEMTMTVHLSYWSFAKSAFVPIPHLAKRIALGTATNGTVQEGVAFTFNPPVILSGSITFQWRLDGMAIATTTRSTSHGDKGVDDSDPKGYSTATCSMDE
jgi:hypothetical protein